MRLKLNAESIDDLLDGGFEHGVITEIYGEAGTGKTNICLQLAREIAREGKKVAYIDTEGVSMERLSQMCGDDYEEVLKNILHYKPLNLAQQRKHVDGLTKIPGLGMIIVDSINIFTRMGKKSDPMVDSKFLKQIMKLQHIARESKLPIVVTAQVYSSGADVQPFSEKTMAHFVKAILRLDKVHSDIIGEGRRKATLMKHRSIPEGKQSEFSLTAVGVE